MMKVLHCIFSLKGGGAERQLLILALQSQNCGIESAIFLWIRSGLSGSY